jgi:hypothetical protein
MRRAATVAWALLLPCLAPPLAAGEPPEEELRGLLRVEAQSAAGGALTISWSQVQGPRARILDAAAAETEFVAPAPGDYEFEVRVSDGRDSFTGRRKVNVPPPVPPPEAVAGAAQQVEVGQTALVDGGRSSASDRRPLTAWRWRQLEGPRLDFQPGELHRRQFDFLARKSGKYVFELTVSDGRKWSAPALTAISVLPPNRRPLILEPELQTEFTLPLPGPRAGTALPGLRSPPIVQATVRQEGADLVLDGAASRDPLGEELEYLWTQVHDGEAPHLGAFSPDPAGAAGKTELQAPVWRCRPPKPGTYKFVLEVSAGKSGRLRRGFSPVLSVEFK